jgi:hypothetical protein
MIQVPWPRYMVQRPLASGVIAYYWAARKKDVDGGFPIKICQSLGTDYAEAVRRCDGDPSVEGDRGFNGVLDDWRAGKEVPTGAPRFGTLKWLFHHYEDTRSFKRCSAKTRKDYRRFLGLIADVETLVGGKPGKLGDQRLPAVDAQTVDLIYDELSAPPKDERGNEKEGARKRLRQANKSIDVAAHAWRAVRRLHKTVVPLDNPFEGVTKEINSKETVPATRAEAYALAEALANLGHVSLGLAALAAFEWHQRPENILAGHLKWTDYRPADRPTAVQVAHAKTRKLVWLPLEDKEGSLFPEIEAFIARVPRFGVPMVLIPDRETPKLKKRTPAHSYTFYYARKTVRAARRKAKLPEHVTLAACRHGGMTELGDAEITEAGVMSLSGHKTPDAARLYVKRTEVQRAIAARRRRAWIETGEGDPSEAAKKAANAGTKEAQESKRVSTPETLDDGKEALSA